MNKELQRGTTLSHYRIVSKIGAGGMGEVYLAHDTKLGRNVAIKLLNEEFIHDPEKLKRFVQEAKAASALNHPNILTIYEIGEADGKSYISTELIEGKTLREHLLHKGSFTLGQVLRIGVQVAEALSAAHRAGIIHRDIKPENIMIRDDGYAKILDFGLAKLTEAKSSDKAFQHGDANTLVQTNPGIVMGTVSYMSPEQARGQGTDVRTDLWSLGVLLYEMLAGQRPFSGDTASHTIVAILEHDPPPVSAAGIEMPAEAERIITRALAKDVASRYQTAEELADDLRALEKRLEFERELDRSSSPDSNIATEILPTGPTATSGAGNTIAVLPFVNMSPTGDGDYFSDGLAEELLNVLSKIRGLKVAARTSAFSFKGKQATIAEIGKALNVASVLEGSIRTAGGRVRISVQLVKVSDGYHLWSDTYDRTMDDIFAVQDDIAEAVVKELRLRLLGEEPGTDASGKLRREVAEAARGRATNPEAQRLMLLGRYFLDRTTREDTAKGVEYLLEALDLDPDYALGWAELGRAYAVQTGRGWLPETEGFDRSREATNRALSLDPDLAEGHALLGRIQVTHDFDLPGAERSYKRALELAPGSSSVLDGAAVMAYKLGRLDEALNLSRRSLVQDPLSAAFWHNLGLTSHAAGRLAESEKAFRRALELVPQRFVTRALLATVLMDQGREREASELATEEPEEFWRQWAFAIVHHVAGRQAAADEVLDELEKECARGNAYQIAEIHAVRGEADLAFRWLERAFEERDSGLTHAKVNPRFRVLYADPRWPDLLSRIGFNA